MNIASTWTRIAQTGVTKAVDPHLARKLILSNQIAMSISIVCLLAASAQLLLGSTMLAFFFVSGGPSYVVTIAFNHYGHHTASRVYLNFLPPLLIVIYSGLLDFNDNSMQFALVSVILVPVLLFGVTEMRKMLVGIAWVAFNFLIIDVAIDWLPHIPGHSVAATDATLNIKINGMISFIMFTAAFVYFQRLNHKAESELSRTLSELQALNHQLKALSDTDGLTGIANRRHFDRVAATEWTRAARSGEPLSVALLDVDWFKPYNDLYGHLGGDECLRKLAQVLRTTVCRTGDLVARYGGEEFVFIAPSTNGSQALGVAKKLCEAMRALAIPNSTSTYQYLTVSIGVASIVPAAGDSFENLLQRADQALYLAKDSGRNTAVLAT